MPYDVSRQTWELTTLQRGLVDNCFEEGQYETAIATLEQTRSSEFKPWPPHIRQLVYISLQPISESTIPEDEEDTPLQASPSKIVKQHQHRMSLNPIPPKAVANAQKLLMAYLNTNAPDALFRALPRRRSPLSLLHGHTEGDSTVAKRALCVLQAKDCWELLHSEFLCQSVALSTPKAKTRYSERIGHSRTGALDSETVSPMVVTERAWPLFEWLISLFERDEKLKYTDGAQARYSPLLADQILDDNQKTYFDVPIAIIVHCLAQQQQQRQRLASRLLSLLVNLTSIPEVDLQALLLAFYTRAHSVDSISQLISQLNQPTSMQVLKFKIGLCQKFIGGLGLPATGGGAPRPQPRMRGRTSKAAGKQPDIVDTLPTIKQVPVTSEILRLFQTPQPEPDFSGSISRSLWYRFQLLSAYGTLQANLPPGDRDSDWLQALTGNLPQIVHDVLQQKGNEASVYKRLLENQITSWRVQ